MCSTRERTLLGLNTNGIYKVPGKKGYFTVDAGFLPFRKLSIINQNIFTFVNAFIVLLDFFSILTQLGKAFYLIQVPLKN